MLAILDFFYKYSFECVHQSSNLEKRSDLRKQSQGWKKKSYIFFENSYKKYEFIKIIRLKER